ncbi:hypothetical protein JXJ21_17695 [candidate division KSB1 bacterium]|nr:hypothetical protein [candidate division KSB1 bacterium]
MINFFNRIETTRKRYFYAGLAAFVLLFSNSYREPWGYASLYAHPLYASPAAAPASNDERDMDKAADRIYRNGVNSYFAGEYWNCAQELIILLDFYPQFDKIDGVVYYIGESLNEMEMNNPALKMFKYLIKMYPQSEYVPNAMLGIQKIYFREEKFNEVMNYYFLIIKNNYENEVADAARYYHAQSNFYLNKWENAILILRRINPASEYYDHALYTTGLAMLKKKEFAPQYSI